MEEKEPTSHENPSPDDGATVLHGHSPAGHIAPGSRVGHYTIREVLGEGGFAVVYLAEQTEPVRRRVALKVIKLGMDTKQVLARFEAERQALAMMDHPCVAKVFDAGVTDDGRSYFVMEHVPGVPITEHCDRQKLSITERLNLFMQVCDAVQHAHQKGIIHRDLKPGNVLVSVKEGSAVPKVIDFGVAKALHQKLTEKTLFTEQGQLIGTPEYMSPEQAEMTAQDIDTRTDIYSLGVLLYELLTGALPFDPKSLRKAAFAEIQRIIREQEPPRPSTKLSSLGDASTTNADKRRLDPRSLMRELRGDLDWIVMKALEKDRQHRYETANALAMDLQRHLAHEPVLAGPPSATYKLRKFVRRNRGAVAAAGVIALVLIAATAVSIGFAVSEAEQRRAAQAAEREQSRARKEAEQARTDEQKQRHIADLKTDEAVDARMEAETQRDVARRESYVANIVAAQASIQAGEFQTARLRLDQAPAELRGWEWKYLHARLDTSLAVLRGHEDSVLSVACSPDGSRIVSGSADGTVRLWDASSGDELLVLRGHEKGVRSVAFSLDGSRIASGSSDKTVRLWDVSSGQQVAVLRGHENRVNSVAFSPDGSRIASGSDDSTVRLWDTSSGEQVAVSRVGRVLSLTFSPDGSRIASGSRGNTVWLWDAASGEELLALRGHEGYVNSVAFSPDGSRIASASGDGTVRVWDALSGAELAVLRGHRNWVRSVAFSPDGSQIASASSDNTLRLWDVASGEQVAVLRGHEGSVWSVAFSPDGSRVASASTDNTVRLWDASSPDELSVLRGHEGRVTSVAFSPDGMHIASRSRRRELVVLRDRTTTVRLWDASSGDQLTLRRYTRSSVTSSVRFSPDWSRIAYGSADNTVRLWDASGGGEELAVLRGHEGPVTSVAFSSDGLRMASGSDDKTIRLWDASSGEELVVLRGHEGRVYSVAFSPDGSRIGSESRDTVRLWDASNGDQLAVLRRGVSSVAFSPDWSRIASWVPRPAVVSRDQTVRLWDTASGQQVAVLRGHENRVYSVAFSLDGTQIVTASQDQTARIWDATTGEQLVVLRGHERLVRSVAFSPDGSRIASGSGDETVRLWDASSGQELVVLRGHENSVSSVTFSPDGSRIASGSQDETVRLWDTVAYRDRVRQRDAARRAEETIRPFINELFSEGLNCTAVADRVRTDACLSEPHRRAAINLLMKRCSAIREQAREAYQQALTYFDEGQYDNAEPLLSTVLETVRRSLGPDSPETVPLIELLANLHNKQGRFDEARPYMAELISIRKRAAQQKDASADAINEYASLLLTCEPSDLRDPKAALPIALRVNELTDHDNPSYLDTLSLAYDLTGDTAKAIENQKKAMSVRRRAKAQSIRIYKRDAERQDARADARNAYAWKLLTVDPVDLDEAKAALAIALRANEMTDHENPMYLDTLALAQHLTGNTPAAIETEKTALSLLPPDAPGRSPYEAALAKFEAALKDEPK